MRKTKTVVDTTTNSKEYKRAKHMTLLIGCQLCSPNKGCNKWGKSSPSRNWKSYRKTKWK